MLLLQLCAAAARGRDSIRFVISHYLHTARFTFWLPLNRTTFPASTYLFRVRSKYFKHANKNRQRRLPNRMQLRYFQPHLRVSKAQTSLFHHFFVVIILWSSSTASFLFSFCCVRPLLTVCTQIGSQTFPNLTLFRTFPKFRRAHSISKRSACMPNRNRNMPRLPQISAARCTAVRKMHEVARPCNVIPRPCPASMLQFSMSECGYLVSIAIEVYTTIDRLQLVCRIGFAKCPNKSDPILAAIGKSPSLQSTVIGNVLCLPVVVQ